MVRSCGSRTELGKDFTEVFDLQGPRSRAEYKVGRRHQVSISASGGDLVRPRTQERPPVTAPNTLKHFTTTIREKANGLARITSFLFLFLYHDLPGNIKFFP